MSESNLPLFGPARLRRLLGTFRLTRLKEALGLLYTRRRDAGSTRAYALEPRVVQSIRGYLDAHASNLERAVRLGEKAERLEKAGTPSESARNRAERARAEVVVGLAALRASFVEAAGEREGARTFDRAVKLLCPAFMPRGQQDWQTR
jgi:hypothetical protein